MQMLFSRNKTTLAVCTIFGRDFAPNPGGEFKVLPQAA